MNSANDQDLQSRILLSTLDEVAARDADADADAAECCVICLDVITEPCEARPCGHRNFDYICVSSWLFETPHCPLCKALVANVIHGPDDARITTLFGQKPASATSAAQASPRFSRNAHRARPPCPASRPRRFRDSHRPVATVSDVVACRRDVYRHQRYSKHVGSNRLSRYRELTPQLFCTDAELVSRARMWTRRELRVFSFLSPNDDDETRTTQSANTSSTTMMAAQRRRANNAEFLLEYVIAILKSVDIMGSGGQATDMLSDFLGSQNAKLFLHELRAWLRSPFTKLEDWDRAVQYEAAAAAAAPDRTNLRRDVAGDAGRTVGEASGRSCQGLAREPGQKGDYYRPRRHQHLGRRGGRGRSGDEAVTRRPRRPMVAETRR